MKTAMDTIIQAMQARVDVWKQEEAKKKSRVIKLLLQLNSK